MKTVAIPNCLNSLVEFLNGLTARVPMEQLEEHLLRLNIKTEELLPHMVFGERCYRRNVISESQWYELLCICWKSGQRSPIHNHAESTCGLRVVEGVATETTFEFAPCGQIKPTESVDMVKGQVCCTQDADIHQVSNLQSEDDCLITLHIYSPPLRVMDTYSITDGFAGKYEV